MLEERELEKRMIELSVLYEISSIPAVGLSIEEILNHAIDKASRLMKCERAAIFLLDEQRQVLTPGVTFGFKKDLQIKIAPGKGIVGKAFSEGRARVASSSDAGEPLLEGYPSRFALAVPIKMGDKALGVIYAARLHKREFTTDEIRLFTILADRICVALQNAVLYDGLRRLKEFNEKIVRNAPIGIFTTDAKGRITSANPMFLEMMGAKGAEQAMGLNVFELSTIKERGYDKYFRDALRGNTVELSNVEYFFGKPIHLSVKITPLKDERGWAEGLLCLLEDVTEKKRLEREIINANNIAEFYLDLMGHDIINANSIAVAYLELLSMDPGLREEQRDAINKSLSAIRRSTALIENVRKLRESKETGREFKIKDLSEVLTAAIRAVKENYSDREIEVNYTPREMPVLADDLIRDLFLNLLDNAVKFNASSRVVVDVVAEELEDSWKIGIIDRGRGVPDTMKELIFNRFEKIGDGVRGSGIGLYLVKTLVDKYGGRVWVEDRVKGDPSKGSAFYVTLPRRC
jgi:PAS domain S-box-containing protein